MSHGSSMENKLAAYFQEMLKEYRSRITADVSELKNRSSQLLDEFATELGLTSEEIVQDKIVREVETHLERLHREAREKVSWQTEYTHSVRGVCEAFSQRETLRNLMDSAARISPRCILFLLRQERIVGWESRGYGDDVNSNIKDYSVNVDDEYIFKSVKSAGKIITLTRDDLMERGDFPAIHGLPTATCLIVAPLYLFGAMTAILVLDGDNLKTDINDARMAVYRILTVAALWLENIVMRKSLRIESPAMMLQVPEIDITPPSSETPEGEIEPRDRSEEDLLEEAENETVTTDMESSDTATDFAIPTEGTIEEGAEEFIEEPPATAQESEMELPEIPEEAAEADEDIEESDDIFQVVEPVGEPEAEIAEEIGEDEISLEDLGMQDMSTEVDEEIHPSPQQEEMDVSAFEETMMDDGMTHLDEDEIILIEDEDLGEKAQAEEPGGFFDDTPRFEETIETGQADDESAVETEFDEEEIVLEETSHDDMIMDGGAPAVPPETLPAEGVEIPSGVQTEAETWSTPQEEKLHNDARRFARLLVSEIKLYNEDSVSEGRIVNDLYKRLKRDIDRSRDMYQKRVDPVVAGKVDYFHEEIVRILGEGDPVKMGESYPGPQLAG